MNGKTHWAVALGLATLMIGLAGQTQARADEGWRRSGQEQHVRREIRDVRNDETRLCELQDRRDWLAERRDWRAVRRIDRQIEELRRHIARDREHVYDEIEDRRQDRDSGERSRDRDRDRDSEARSGNRDRDRDRRGHRGHSSRW